MTIMRIAVTGGIAAGKSTVVNHLRSLGAFVIDYDVLARKVVEPGSAVLQQIVGIFGENAVKNDGSLNRAFIAERIFGDGDERKQALSKIESIITVEAPQEIRVKRMISERNMTENQALARINSQLPSKVRKAMADFVVDSTKPMESMLNSVDDTLKSWLCEISNKSAEMAKLGK